MTDSITKMQRRLSQLTSTITGTKRATDIPFDPDSTLFPNRRELPKFRDAPDDCAWVWGEDDQLGRLNLLTPNRVKAAQSEIRTGETIPLNLPLDMPKKPGFDRESFEHKIKVLRGGMGHDDLYSMNTQSGTQWDGFRHFAHIPTLTFYNNVKGKDIVGPEANLKDSIHWWSEHGIAGRGILLDYWGYAKEKNIVYDPYTTYAISWDELNACGKHQGIDIRPEAQGGDIKVGDMLFIRSGFVEAYNKRSPEQRASFAKDHPFTDEGSASDEKRGTEWAGVKQEQAMIDWLHDCWFATVAGDAPAFEAYPTQERYHLHEYLLALWGVPIGEMANLERLARRCNEQGRWTFFVTSSPSNCPGGVASHMNAIAIL